MPPSPASVCSSVNEEFWRPGDYFSPASTPDVHPLDESDMPRVFREISSNLSGKSFAIAFYMKFLKFHLRLVPA